MRVYRLIENRSYIQTHTIKAEYSMGCAHCVHPKALDAYRHIIYLSEDGMDIPDTPCVIIDDEVPRGVAPKVILPDGDVWNLGGRTYVQRHDFPNIHYPQTDFAYMIWKYK